MTSPVQQLVQNIATLRSLELQQMQQEIARQNQESSGRTGFQSLLQGLADPTQMLPFAGQFGVDTGLSEEALQTIIRQTPAAASTTRSRAVQQGAGQTGGSLNVPAATRELAGTDAAGLASSSLMSRVLGGTEQYFNDLPEERRQPFLAGVLQRLGTGEDVGTAAENQAIADFFENATPEVRTQAVAVGKRLAPTATEDAQLRLGWADLRLRSRQFEAGIALEEMRTRASLAEAQRQVSATQLKELNDLVKARSDLLTTMARNSATMTPEGVRSFAEQLNSYNQQLRMLAPGVYGPQGSHKLEDLQIDKTVSATGVLPFLGQWLSKNQ